MSSTAAGSPRPHRLTVEDFYRMGAFGILRPDERVELIEGEIIDMPPPGSRHAGTVNQLTRILQRAVGDNAIVQIQNPITLNEYSEPQPDLALLHARVDYYRSAHPRPKDVLLVIEVADTSLRYDRDVKALLYARHKLPELWLIDVENKQLTRYRDPAKSGYTWVDRPDVAVAISVRALPEVSIEIGAVFAD